MAALGSLGTFAYYVILGLLVGSLLGTFCEQLLIGSVAGAMMGIWAAFMLQLLDLPSKRSKGRPLVRTVEQEVVKQWTKEEKQTQQLGQMFEHAMGQ